MLPFYHSVHQMEPLADLYGQKGGQKWPFSSFQPILAHFGLRIQDRACYAKLVFPNKAIFFPR